MTVYDTWCETALVAITAEGGENVSFGTITETVDIDIGEKGFDVITTLSGGRLIKFTPQEPTTITFDAYPMEAGTSSGTTGKGFFDLLYSPDSTEPQEIKLDRERSRYRIALLWSDDTSQTDACGQEVSPEHACMRIVAAKGLFTTVKPSFTDGVLKFTVTYKTSPFNKDRSANVIVQSLDGSTTATLATLASYTSSTNW